MVAATTVAELWLPPAVHHAGEGALIVAGGTSCRRQIEGALRR